jgi:DDE superfamily endonuclease
VWSNIDTLLAFVEPLRCAFTEPSFRTHSSLILAWLMCLGPHQLLRVFRNSDPSSPGHHSDRHGFDRFYNFFERSAWTPSGLAHHVGVLILTRLPLYGTITLLVDDTLAHKRGKSVWGIGWFRDAVASTKKRVATASGHNWVVLAVAFCSPFSGAPIFALPLLARLHHSGKGQPSCAQLARAMVQEVVGWYPKRQFTLVGDGAYATGGLLKNLDEAVVFVGRMRGDAAVYDPRVPKAKKGRRGPKAKKGPRLPSPKQAAKKADRKRGASGDWHWQQVEVTIYGQKRVLQALSYEVVWPWVLDLQRILVVVVRDPEGKLDDVYLFTTKVGAKLEWVITQYAWRWAIEVLFRASKQVLEVEKPQHWAQASVEKVAPWVWSMQSVVMVWYLSEGYKSAEAEKLRGEMGEWDSEWSLRHMMQVLRLAVLEATIKPNSDETAELKEAVETLKNWAILAA